MGWRGRLGAATVAAGCAAMLAVGAWLTPSPVGHGTHLQLGMAPCTWLAVFDRPCPTCGMTTAVSLMAHGRPIRAFLTQPFGAFVGLVAAALFWLALHAAITGARTGRVAGSLLGKKTAAGVGAAFLASWAYALATWPDH